jgi:hypothetical protein
MSTENTSSTSQTQPLDHHFQGIHPKQTLMHRLHPNKSWQWHALPLLTISDIQISPKSKQMLYSLKPYQLHQEIIALYFP